AAPSRRNAAKALDMAALLIVHWRLVPSGFDWTLAVLTGLLLLSLVVWRAAPAARRRIRFVWALLLTSLRLWLSDNLSSAPLWLRPAELALEQLVALHLVVMLVFYVALRRFGIPRILSDLAIGCGYAAIILGMLMRVGVNLTGIIATSAVAT